MTNPFDILEILPTTDVRQIKKAYARLAAVYHPEEFPEEFQRLHEAYGEALKIAKSGNIPPSAPATGHAPSASAPRNPHRSGGSSPASSGLYHPGAAGGDASSDRVPSFLYPADEPADSSEEDTGDMYNYEQLFEQEKFQRLRQTAEAAEALVSEARSLIEDARTRSNIKAWNEFLNSAQFIRLKDTQVFLDAYADFLSGCRQMKRPIWKLHDKAFHISRFQKPPRGAYEKIYGVLDSRYQGVKVRSRENAFSAGAVILMFGSGILLGRGGHGVGAEIPVSLLGGILTLGFLVLFVSIRKRLNMAYQNALFALLLILVSIFVLAGNQIEVGVMRSQSLANVCYGVLCFGIFYGLIAGIWSLTVWVKNKNKRF